MFDIGSIITSFGEGVLSLLPMFGEALVETFLALFFTAAESGGGYTLNPLGMISIFYLVISACYKFLPTIIGWFKLKMRSYRAKRRKSRT